MYTGLPALYMVYRSVCGRVFWTTQRVQARGKLVLVIVCPPTHRCLLAGRRPALASIGTFALDNAQWVVLGFGAGHVVTSYSSRCLLCLLCQAVVRGVARSGMKRRGNEAFKSLHSGIVSESKRHLANGLRGFTSAVSLPKGGASLSQGESTDAPRLATIELRVVRCMQSSD